MAYSILPNPTFRSKSHRADYPESRVPAARDPGLDGSVGASHRLKWQAVYSYMISHTVATAWHYPVLRRRYTHEQVVVHIHDSEDTEESLPVIEMLSVP